MNGEQESVASVPVTTLRTEVVVLSAAILEQVRILRFIRGTMAYDAGSRSLRCSVSVWDRAQEELELPVLGYVWAPATAFHRACWWLVVVMPEGVINRVHVPALSAHHFEPPPGMENLPQIFVVEEKDIRSAVGV